MKSLYLFGVLLGVKTILAEVASKERAPESYYSDGGYDNGVDGYGPEVYGEEYPDDEGYEYNEYPPSNSKSEPAYRGKNGKYDQRPYQTDDDGDDYQYYQPEPKPVYKPEPRPGRKPNQKPKSEAYDDRGSYYEEKRPSYPTKANGGYKHPRPDQGGYGNYDQPGYGHFKGSSGYGTGGDRYGYDKFGRPDYGNPTYPPPIYEPYTANYKPVDTAPFPYTVILDDKKKENLLKVPKLGDYHCFLTGAPWTSCGRKSLTTYFLDQCLVLYFSLSANVDGICGGEPPKPTPEPEVYNDYYYGKDYKKRPTPEPTTARPSKQPEEGYGAVATPSPTPSSYEITPDYLKEKCLQSSYVSITTATVMCLTENYIRINFIEHYAATACNNPIEGPILYLKKIHDFIKGVLDCETDGAKNFPSLYRTFSSEGRITYNPNAPYALSGDKIVLQQYTSPEASGLSAFTIGDSFICGNPNELATVPTTGGLSGHTKIYLSLPHNSHYKVGKSAPPPSGTKEFEQGNMYKTCLNSGGVSPYSAALGKLGLKNVYRFCKTGQFTVDRTYRGLYDAVHYIQGENSALRRPQSIAEIAVQHAGVLEQPILEGFGIMYYCAFHACRANNEGDLSKCYPEFNQDPDWSKKANDPELKTLSDTVNDCIDDGYLTSVDIEASEAVKIYSDAIAQRSYLCMAENVIVKFALDVLKLGSGVYSLEPNDGDAFEYVYLRHLADEVCYVKTPVDPNAEVKCTDNESIYVHLNKALADLAGVCKTKKEKKIPVSEGYGGYQQPYYGNPQYGYGKY